MIMEDSYLSDLKDFIRETPDEIFTAANIAKEEILSNNTDILDKMWIVFQKDIEEYDCDAPYAYYDALLEVIGIHYEETYIEKDKTLLSGAQWIPTTEKTPIPGKINKVTGQAQEYMCQVMKNGIIAPIALSFSSDQKWFRFTEEVTPVIAWQDLPVDPT